MEPLSDILKYNKELYQKRANIAGPKKYNKRKKPKQLPLKIFKGFTQIPHFILESIISDENLNKREIKVLLLITRLTIGLHRTSVDLIKINFGAAKVGSTHISKILISLAEKQWIAVNNTTKTAYYSLHKSRFDKKLAVNNRELNDLIHDKLIKYLII